MTDLVCVFVFFHFLLAPISSLREAISRGTLGDLNPTPWAFMTGNCLGWVSYAVATQDLFVLCSNAPGLILSIWLNMGAAKLQYQQMHQLVNLQDDDNHHRRHDGTADSHSLHLQIDNEDDDDEDDDDHESVPRHVNSQEQQLENSNKNSSSSRNTSSRNAKTRLPTMTHDDSTSPSLFSSSSFVLPSFTPHEIWVLRVVLVWLIILCAVCFIPMTSTQQANIIGSAVNMNLVIFYGAPLSTIVQVVKTRNSSSIHRRTMVMGLFNSFFWLCYGIALMDMIIFFPNITGFMLGIIQVALCTFFPRSQLLLVRDADATVQEHLVADDSIVMDSAIL